jgi:HAD superfamily hydrolase (TIGR01484 family)
VSPIFGSASIQALCVLWGAALLSGACTLRGGAPDASFDAGSGLKAVAASAATGSARAQDAGSPRIRYFYTDLDDTLLDRQGRVQAAAREAFARFRAMGGRVGIATGRLPRWALAHACEIGADLPLVLADGAILSTPEGRILRALPLADEALVREVCALIAGARCRHLYTAFASLAGSADRVTLREGFCGPSADPSQKLVRIRARQCGEHRKLLAALRRLGDRVNVEESGRGPWLGVTVSALGVSKGNALREIAGRVPLNLRELAFIGDGGNDLSAVEVVRREGGRCFAVANAIPELKAACPNHTRRDHAQGAVAEALEQLLAEGR